MIRHIVLGLALTTAVAAPVVAQTPASPGPVTQGVAVQADANQGSGQGPGRRAFPRQGGGLRGFGGLDAPALAAPVVSSGPAPGGPPPKPADASVTASLQSSVSAVFDPGGKTARIKLIETDEHGVEGLRTLKPGDLYRDGWRLNAVTASEATLRKGKSVLHVNFSRGWTTRPALIQPAVLVQPVLPAGPSNSLRGLSSVAGRRGQPAAPGGRAGVPGFGLSNARVGGSPLPPAPAAANMSFPSPGGPVRFMIDPQGNATVTGPNGQTFQIPSGLIPRPN